MNWEEIAQELEKSPSLNLKIKLAALLLNQLNRGKHIL
jgi:hypothetical protein